MRSDTTLNDFDYYSRSQGYRKARTSAAIQFIRCSFESDIFGQLSKTLGVLELLVLECDNACC